MKKRKNIYEMFKEVGDVRRKQGQKHRIEVILTIVTMAIMSGYQGQRAKGDFIKKHRQELIKLFKPKKGWLPSYQTIARVMSELDFERLADVFYKWSGQYIRIEEKECIEIDGKAIKGTVKNAQNGYQRYINVVSAFASKRKQVLLSRSIDNGKASEIGAVQPLITCLDLEGVEFTLDALHCQKETVKTIVDSNNDYIIGVKGNQPRLLETLKKRP